MLEYCIVIRLLILPDLRAVPADPDIAVTWIEHRARYFRNAKDTILLLHIFQGFQRPVIVVHIDLPAVQIRPAARVNIFLPRLVKCHPE